MSPSTLTIVTFVLALLAFIAAVVVEWQEWDWRQHMGLSRHPEHETDAWPPTPSGRHTPVWIALFLLILAATISVIDHKVADAHASSAPTDHTATVVPAPASRGPDWSAFASEVRNFAGAATLHTRTTAKLCLVRYFDRTSAAKRGDDPGANWWTTCAANAALHTILAVRERLALPRVWGARDGQLTAKIPANVAITYLRGVARRQCEPGGKECYPGGGVQLLFRSGDFDRDWITTRRCAVDGVHERLRMRFTAAACTS